MKEVYVITERDKYGESIIGIADSIESSKKMISKYYDGKSTVVNYRDIRDSNIEYEMDIIYDMNEPCKVTVESFNLNEL